MINWEILDVSKYSGLFVGFVKSNYNESVNPMKFLSLIKSTSLSNYL